MKKLTPCHPKGPFNKQREWPHAHFLRKKTLPCTLWGYGKERQWLKGGPTVCRATRLSSEWRSNHTRQPKRTLVRASHSGDGRHLDRVQEQAIATKATFWRKYTSCHKHCYDTRRDEPGVVETSSRSLQAWFDLMYYAIHIRVGPKWHNCLWANECDATPLQPTDRDNDCYNTAINRFGTLRMLIHICWRLCLVINVFTLHQDDILLLQLHLWRDPFK